MTVYTGSVHGLQSFTLATSDLISCRAVTGVQLNFAMPGWVGLQAETGAVSQTLERSGAQPVLASAWSADGQPVVSCEKNGTVTFWGN